MDVSVTERPAPLPPSRYAALPRPSRWAEWLAGWRVGLRLARRDVRRHAGRSALIVVMVAMPVLLLVGGNVLFSTQDLNTVEQLPYLLGQTQAKVTYQGLKLTPYPGQTMGGGGYVGPDLAKDQQGTPIPGWGETMPAQVSALATLLGGTVIPVTTDSGSAKAGKRTLDVSILGIDAAAYPTQVEGLVHLTSGRWPTSATEAVVTPAGAFRGLPTSGSVEVTGLDGQTRATYSVVGVGEGWTSDYQTRSVDLVSLPTTSPAAQTAYLLDRRTPVTWAEVKRLADYGLAVDSREVTLHPPSRAELDLPPEVIDNIDSSQAGQTVTTAIAAIGLLLETTLLVGPAFAVSAARQRRTLALAASNGATTPQLRRSVLAQALVLGALSALVGAAVGLALAYAAVAWSGAHRPDAFFGPFEIPAWPVAFVVVAAVGSAVIAALVPARGLGRLDIVGVMRGQSVSPPARVRTPVAGLVLAAIGAVLVFWAVARGGDGYEDNSLLAQLTPLFAMLGAVLLVVGALLLVPMLLVLLGMATAGAPVAMRMALRDAARQRGRATSTVAAILAGTALLAAVLIPAMSVSAFEGQHYVPRLPDGQASISPSWGPSGPPQEGDGSVRRIADVVRAVDPVLQVRPVSVVDTQPYATKEAPTGSATDAPTQPFVVALRKGCTASDALSTGLSMEPGSFSGAPSLGCASLRGSMTEAQRSLMRVADVGSLVATYSLTDSQAAILRDGGIVVDGDPAGPLPTIHCDTVPVGRSCYSVGPLSGQVDIIDGVVTFATGTVTYDQDGAHVQPGSTTFTLPAVAVPGTVLAVVSGNGGMPGSTGALMTTATASAHNLATTVQQVDILDPRGPMSQETESRLRIAVEDNSLGYLYVERGFQAFPTILVVIVVGVIALVILVATLVSTALSTAETQSMMGTFAAVGATRMTRRNLAAAQAASLGVVGALVGILVGSVPGIALARVVTSYDYSNGSNSRVDPTVVIPWLPLAVPVLVIPALAGAIAWLAIRRAPIVTRRLT
jgi:putative ABC transport system permease protein